MEENELTTSYANSEPSLHNARITSTENIGNAHGATLMEGENCLSYHLMGMGIPIFYQVVVTIVVAENDTPIQL